MEDGDEKLLEERTQKRKRRQILYGTIRNNVFRNRLHKIRLMFGSDLVGGNIT